jgi:hypothetical protein
MSRAIVICKPTVAVKSPLAGSETSRERRAFHRKSFSNSARELICFAFASHHSYSRVCLCRGGSAEAANEPPMSRQHSAGPSPKLLFYHHMKIC